MVSHLQECPWGCPDKADFAGNRQGCRGTWRQQPRPWLLKSSWYLVCQAWEHQACLESLRLWMTALHLPGLEPQEVTCQ